MGHAWTLDGSAQVAGDFYHRDQRRSADAPARESALCGSDVLLRQGDLEGWKAHQDESLNPLAESLDDVRGIAQGNVARGLFKEYFENDIEGAESLYRRALEYGRKLDDKLLLGQLLGPLAGCALKHYEYARADEIYRQSLALFCKAENSKEIAGAYGTLAEVALSRRDYESARISAEESLALYRELDDKHGVATALRTLSVATHNQGDAQQAQLAAEQGATLFRQLGDRTCLGLTLAVLARHVLGQGDAGRAEEIVQEAIKVLHEAGEMSSQIGALDLAGRVALARGDLFKAQKYFREGISHLKDSTDVSQLPSLLEGLANALARSTQTRDALLLLGAADALREQIHLARMQFETAEYDALMSMLREDANFQSAWKNGRVMMTRQAIDLALKEGDAL
ncbi:MAG: tetratricopeptide repeat protein [Anaerolineales bacterium]